MDVLWFLGRRFMQLMTEKLTDNGLKKRSSKNECCIFVLMKTVFVIVSSDLHLKVSQTHSEFAFAGHQISGAFRNSIS